MSAAAPAFASELLRLSFPSAVLQHDVSYLVYIPDDYRSGTKRYPVLYLLHGAGGDETAWLERGHIKDHADRLIAAGEIPPAIIVMPGCPGCWWVDGAKDKGETAFWSDVVPAIEQGYRTQQSRLGRLIAGVSAGGYGAIRFAMKYPDRIAAVAALSPAIYSVTPPSLSSARRDPAFLRADGQFNQSLWSAENYPRLSAGYFAQPNRVPIYLATGDRDELGIAYETLQLFNILSERQPLQVELNLVEGRHDWNVWGATLDDAMRYIFRYTRRDHASMGPRL